MTRHGDLAEAAEVALALVGAADPHAPSWDEPVHGLDWTGRQVLAHLTDVATAYALALAGRLDAPWPTFPATPPGTPVVELLTAARAATALLDDVAAIAPSSVRAFHPAGLADPDGFVVMMIDELLVHTHDIATALETGFAAPDHLVRRVLDRLFPWWPEGADPWAALLWANGRTDLPDRASPGPAWVWHCAPIVEWDGRIPRWDVELGALDATASARPAR